MSDDEKPQGKVRNPSKLAVQNIMRTADGRDWIWGYLQSCHVFDSIFDADPVKHGYNAGKRSAGLNLERDLKEHAPDDYMKMMKENFNG
ncbi:MAG: hypothetical protein KAU21_17385 [Gammaproteobacteria bacterium]|nr:hypothetical protein [Gammaproteobacteria bacterium]